MIGLGAVGAELLSSVALFLNGRFDHHWQSVIKLIYIDTSFNQEELSVPYGLDESQCIFLRPNLAEVRKNMIDSPKDWQHWNWYDPSRKSFGRMDGRMSIFYDLKDGMNGSKVYSSIQKAFLGLNSANFNIKVLGSTFDSMSSGSLVDIVRITQIIIGSSKDIQLWVMGPTNGVWVEKAGGSLTKDEQLRRTLVTLRELERFQINGRKQFDYVGKNNPADVLRQNYDSTVIQTLFLFDPRSKNHTNSQDEVFDVMADSLISTLNSSVSTAINTQISVTRGSNGPIVQRRGIGMLLGMGTFSIQSANNLIEDVMAWRMVRDILFGDEMGLFSTEKTDATTGRYILANKLKHSFIDDDVYKLFFSLDAHKEWEQFVTTVTSKLNGILNGDTYLDGSQLVSRRNSLEVAKNWIKKLVEESTPFEQWEIPRRMKRLQTQLDDMINLFSGDIYKTTVENHAAAQKRLTRLRNQVRRESDIAEDLEWQDYRRYIRQVTPDAPKPSEDQLEKFGKRFGWCVLYDDKAQSWRLYFYIPPLDFSYTKDIDLRSLDGALTPSKIVNSLHQLAVTYTNMGTDDSALAIGSKRVSDKWLEIAKPMLSYNSALATSISGVISAINILVAPGKAAPSESNELHQRLLSVSNSKIELCPTADESTLTLMRIENSIPFESTDIYSAEAWKLTPIFSSDYVWRAEQIAAGIEKTRLSGLFVNYLGEDAVVMESLGLALLYGMVEYKDQTWLVKGIPSALDGETMKEKLDQVYKKVVRDNGAFETHQVFIRAVQDGIEQRRKELASNYLNALEENFANFTKNQIQEKYTLDVDFVQYLGSLLEIESKKY